MITGSEKVENAMNAEISIPVGKIHKEFKVRQVLKGHQQAARRRLLHCESTLYLFQGRPGDSHRHLERAISYYTRTEKVSTEIVKAWHEIASKRQFGILLDAVARNDQAAALKAESKRELSYRAYFLTGHSTSIQS